MLQILELLIEAHGSENAEYIYLRPRQNQAGNFNNNKFKFSQNQVAKVKCNNSFKLNNATPKSNIFLTVDNMMTTSKPCIKQTTISS